MAVECAGTRIFFILPQIRYKSLYTDHTSFHVNSFINKHNYNKLIDNKKLFVSIICNKTYHMSKCFIEIDILSIPCTKKRRKDRIILLWSPRYKLTAMLGSVRAMTLKSKQDEQKKINQRSEPVKATDNQIMCGYVCRRVEHKIAHDLPLSKENISIFCNEFRCLSCTSKRLCNSVSVDETFATLVNGSRERRILGEGILK